MSLPTQTGFKRNDWLWYIAIVAIAFATLLVRANLQKAGGPFFVDTDDAMRMVVVRDFLGGQGWYDLIQHRLNTPYGAEIHWSRLIDLPLAGILLLSQAVLSPAQALVVTGTVWPFLLLAALLWLSARVTLELVGPEGLLPGLVLPILSPAVLSEFNPGRVDHHNVIVVLTVAVLLLTLLARRRAWAAWAAGLAAATSLAIAVEALPVAAAAIVAFGLAFVVDPATRRNLTRFGLGFAGAMVVHLMLARPPARWFEAACDMISPVYALAGIAVGASYVLVSLLPAPRPWQRLALLAGAGVATLVLVVGIYPQCLGGPYAELDPWLVEHWIGAIVEAKPWHESLIDLPAYSLVVGVPVLLGILVAIIAWRSEPARRLGWVVLLVFIVATALIMLAQIRGARLAILPIVPAAAWLIVQARHAYLRRAAFGSALGLIGSWLVFSGVMLAVLVNAAIAVLPAGRAQEVNTARASKLPCLASSSFIDLAGIPPARIMSPIDLGAHILLETSHEVVAAPYHRNEDGVLDAFRFLSFPAADALAIAQKRGLTLFVTCDAMPEMHGAARRQAGTVSNLLAAGTPPDWLKDMSLGGPLRIYAIAP